MQLKQIFKNNKGDTIVEVLISIAVLGLILSVSYALANRDTQYVQQSQERAEAQKISEQQLELLRDYLTPDTDWNASGYKCFDDANPPQPTTATSNCNKGTKDNGVGRYRVRITYASATRTYTVNTTWSSLTSAPQQALAISYKLPVTALEPIGLLPECDDGIDNNDPEDTLADYPADPGCTGYNDSSETDPPPPPPPPVYHTWGPVGGSAYSYCSPDTTMYLPFGDGADGCAVSGSTMHAWRNFNVLYGGVSSGFQAGTATLTICYQNYGASPPPGYSSYQLKVTVGHGPTQVISLPTGGPCASNDINLYQANPSTIRLVWFNDAWVGGDANLQINSIKIKQELDPNPQKPTKAIAGKDYTSCQIVGNPGYCILSDSLYRSSVYSLSSDTAGGNPFRTTYKFNGLVAGNYNFGISYFNGNYGNLPAPPSYSYKVKVSYPGGSRTVYLPIENSQISRHLHDYVVSNLNITSDNPVITLEWQNDSYNPGVYDANFGINSVLLRGN